MHRVTVKHVGSPREPQDVQWMRRNNIETLRRFGQPVLWRHMFTEDDLELGGYEFTFNSTREIIPLKRCPACFDNEYSQTRGDCPVCYGIGIVSQENDSTKHIDIRGRITYAVTPDPAPKYGGFGPAVLTWTIQPDVPEDMFRISDRGVLTRVQQSTVLAPWTPMMADNDLLINVELDYNNYSVEKEIDRHILRQTLPQTLRGFGKAGAAGRQFRVGQTFEMNKLPRGHILYQIPFVQNYTDSAIVNGDSILSAIESGPIVDAATVRGKGHVAGWDELI